MNVYVESNFVLELTLMQEEHKSCEQILSLCESGKVQLFIPAYSLAEPFETLIRRDTRRNQLAKTVEDELNQLGRSTPYRTEVDASQAVVSLLSRSGSEERERLAIIRDRLIQIAEIIPLEKEILSLASIHEAQHDLSPQDAIVYTSVVQHLSTLRSTGSCFLNRNSKDFADPDIEDSLAKYSCKILFSFRRGHDYIQSQI